MSKNNNSTNNPNPTSQPVRLTRGDGGGAPGPKYTIPCPKPKK